MKYGARNTLMGRVTSVTKGDVMTLVKFDVIGPAQMASVITTESADDLALAAGDEVQLVVKAIHVLPVKD
jgi:molybdate transport system regulatory protein